MTPEELALVTRVAVALEGVNQALVALVNAQLAVRQGEQKIRSYIGTRAEPPAQPPPES